MSHEKPVVVVGYDGSPASRLAVAHAVRHVGTDGTLYVVHAYRVPHDYLGTQYYQELLDDLAVQARELIERLPEEIDALADVDWYPEVMTGVPAQAIASVAETRAADEIVIGSRGFGRTRALLGSVSHELIHLAACPVLVIPERAVESETAEPSPQAAAA